MLPLVDVVVRCRNEMPYTQRTLGALRRQHQPEARVLFIDCRSSDGSREAALAAGADAIVDLDPRDYVPGAVLNLGMERTTSPVVAFVNADAIPLSDTALRHLVGPLLEDPLAAASYGRQVARPDADPWTRLDYARAFRRSGTLPLLRGSFFSMAASAIRREVWSQLRFDTTLRYSEDVDWTRRVEALGWHTLYAPEAEFEHSHAYDLRAHHRRREGEGTADSRIHRLGPPGILTEFAGPFVSTVLRDVRAGVVSPTGVAVRAAQALGYYKGRRQAWRSLRA